MGDRTEGPNAKTLVRIRLNGIIEVNVLVCGGHHRAIEECEVWGVLAFPIKA